MADIVLALLAHPDDAEFLCAGTLARLGRERGWHVHVATMTAGDCGSAALLADEISRVRRAEAAAAAAIIDARYNCLEERDLLVCYNERTLESATRLLRQVRPRIVLTHSPADYLLDHEMTNMVVRAAAFAAPVPNFRADADLPPLSAVPHLYYCDAIEGKDALGNAVEPAFRIDISAVIDLKTQMLSRHASQRDWLLRQHGIDQYLKAMRDWAAQHGRACGVAYAEGFRQHLGHGYPQSNLLVELLGRPRTGVRGL